MRDGRRTFPFGPILNSAFSIAVACPRVPGRWWYVDLGLDGRRRRHHRPGTRAEAALAEKAEYMIRLTAGIPVPPPEEPTPLR